MKALIKTSFAIFLLLSIGACASTAGSSSKKSNDYSIYQTMGDAFRSLGGLSVSGQGGDFIVRLRMGKFESSNRAIDLGDMTVLYVIDGKDYGYDYGNISSAVTPKDVASMRVLNGSEAVMKWGDRGTGGVLVITTLKKN